MSLTDWLIYLSFVLASTVTPGPAVLLAMSNATARGVGAAAWSSLGNIGGLSLLSLAAMAGAGSLLAVSPRAFLVLQLAGAAYLVFLGARKWAARSGSGSTSASVPATVRASRRRLFTQGTLVALSNPKAILFFAALLPQFITPARPMLAQFAVLTAVLCVFSFIALMGYAGLARLLRSRAPASSSATVLNRMFAVVFVLLGLWLAWNGIAQIVRG